MYICREHKKRPGELPTNSIRICCLLDDGSIIILTEKFSSLLEVTFDEKGITRIWKNVGTRSSGIFCLCASNSKKIIYMSNKFLRDPKLDGIKPYVLL